MPSCIQSRFAWYPFGTHIGSLSPPRVIPKNRTRLSQSTISYDPQTKKGKSKSKKVSEYYSEMTEIKSMVGDIKISNIRPEQNNSS